MRGFESDRKWIIEKKNDVAIRAIIDFIADIRRA